MKNHKKWESGDNFRDLTENSPNGIIIANENASHVYVNKRTTEITGYSVKELLSISMKELICPDDLKKHQDMYKARLKGEPVPYQYERCIVRKDGTMVSVELTYATTLWEGKRCGIVTIRDITKSQHVEEALRIERDNLKNIFKAMADGVYIVNQQYDIQYVNPVLVNTYGVYEGRKCYEYFHDRTEVCPWCKNPDVFAGKTVRWELFSSKNGKTYDLIDTPLKNLDGSISKLELFRDITESKKAKNTLNRRVEELASLLKTSHALSASLEVNTVLQTTTDSATDLMGIESAAIYLLEGEELYLGAATPPLDSQMPETFRRAQLVDHPHIKKCVSTGFPVILADTEIADLTPAERAISEARDLRTIIYIPILAGKQVVGTLILGTIEKPRAISEVEINLCQTMANQVAGSIQNARLHEKIIQHSKELQDEIRIRKQVEEDLRESEEKYRMLAENSLDAIWQMDLKLVFTYISPSVKSIMGYTVEEWVGTRLSQHTSTKEFFNMARKALYTIKHYKEFKHLTFNAVMLRKDGTEIPVEITAKLLLNKKGLPIGLQGTSRDITNRKKAEEDLKAKVDELKAFNRMVVGRELKMIELKKEIHQLLKEAGKKGRYKLEKNIVKKTLARLEKTVEKRTSELNDKMEENEQQRKATLNLAQDLEALNIELKKEIKDRAKAQKELRKHRDHLDELVKKRTAELEIKTKGMEESQKALTFLMEDVNEARKAMGQINMELTEANKELEAFSYSVSHDLRAPLRAIKGFSKKLRENHHGRLDAEGERLLAVIRSNSQKMEKLIEDLLQFSRAGRSSMRFSDLDMTDLAEDVFRELTNLNPGRKIQNRIKSLPQAYGDRTMMRQVLFNLYSNAFKFTKNEKTASVEVGFLDKNEETVYYVRDNGVGFDMKHADKLFNVFQRLHLEKDFPGTGVGLAIVQRIIHRHRGRVWAEAEVNKGTTFFFTLDKRGE